MKKLNIVAIIGLLLLIMTGCSKNSKFVPTESSIYLKKDGTMTSADMETFDKDSYSIEEFTSYVEEKVIAYNTEKAGLSFAYAKDTKESLPISIFSSTLKDQTISLLLDYGDVTDYLAFNENNELSDDVTTELESKLGVVLSPTKGAPGQLFTGTFEDAKAAGIPVDGAYNTVKDNSKVESTTFTNGKYYIGVIQGEVSVQVEGEIRYISENVTVTGKNEAKLTDNSIVSYIIYK